MKSLRWVVGVVMVAALVTIVVGAQVDREADITGYYNEKNGEFTKITRVGSVYQYVNQQAAGQWIGVGVRDGDTLSIAWQRADGKNLGVSVYRITQGAGRVALTGRWAALGGSSTVKDELTWSRKLE